MLRPQLSSVLISIAGAAFPMRACHSRRIHRLWLSTSSARCAERPSSSSLPPGRLPFPPRAADSRDQLGTDAFFPTSSPIHPQCFTFDPGQRPTASDLLRHPFVVLHEDGGADGLDEEEDILIDDQETGAPLSADWTNAEEEAGPAPGQESAELVEVTPGEISGGPSSMNVDGDGLSPLPAASEAALGMMQPPAALAQSRHMSRPGTAGPQPLSRPIRDPLLASSVSAPFVPSSFPRASAMMAAETGPPPPSAAYSGPTADVATAGRGPVMLPPLHS